MQFNLKFSRKTWYFLLLVSAAASMAAGLALLAGYDLSFLDTVAFAAAGMAVLFLAAYKQPGPDGTPGKTANPYSGGYFGAFLWLMGSYLLFGSHLACRLTLFWPWLARVEQKRGMPVSGQLRLLIFAELAQIGLFFAGLAGGLGLAVSILWVLVCAARGWLALALYKADKE